MIPVRLTAPAAAGALALLLSACSGTDSTRYDNILTTLPVVAEKVAVGNDSMIVAELPSTAEPVIIPASAIMDGLEIVKLDNADDALVGLGNVWVTDSRIVTYDGSVVKMFDRSGKYIGTVGSRGQGPGEYTIAPYDIYVDDNTGNVYLAQYNTDKIMCYGPDGKYQGDIPLYQNTPKSRINVDAEKRTVTVAAMQFEDMTDALSVWTQDFDGNLISGKRNPSLSVPRDFSNEIYASPGIDADNYNVSFFRLPPVADSLYNVVNGEIHPAFTVRFDGDTPMHSAKSIGQLYAVITFGKPVEVAPSSYMIPATTPFVVDKNTLRGGYAFLMLDGLGSIVLESEWLPYNDTPYFSKMMEPGTLTELIETAPQQHELATPEGMAEMNRLKESIDPDDNNYVIIGKWKRP